ncbi:hypothetical protein ACVI1K_005291 [Bradyrhizobium sp. USDA 4508]
MWERGSLPATIPAQLRRPCRSHHPYAAPRTSLRCVCTRRRNCSEQWSPSGKYALASPDFPVLQETAPVRETDAAPRPPTRGGFLPVGLGGIGREQKSRLQLRTEVPSSRAEMSCCAPSDRDDTRLPTLLRQAVGMSSCAGCATAAIGGLTPHDATIRRPLRSGKKSPRESESERKLHLRSCIVLLKRARGDPASAKKPNGREHSSCASPASVHREARIFLDFVSLERIRASE